MRVPSSHQGRGIVMLREFQSFPTTTKISIMIIVTIAKYFTRITK